MNITFWQKIVIQFSAIFAILFVTHYIPVIAQEMDQQETPAYAKWGKMAMLTAKEKYPNAKIRDYLHIGRDVQGNSTIEKFKLWVEENGKEFGLYINIEFDSKTERVKQVHIRKSSN